MRRYSLIVVMLFISLVAFAQTNEAAPENVKRANLENLLVTEQLPRVDNNFNTNSVVIQQVGQGNLSFVNVVSSSSSVTVDQNGNSNNVAISLKGNNIAEEVFQQGNGNSVIDVSSRNASGAGMQVLQKGNNLGVERYGASRSSGPIKVTQSGNGSGRAVIIRQFN